jgi:uncharacterized protein
MILGFSEDKALWAQIESMAQSLDYGLKWIERADQIAPPDHNAPRRQLAEHLVGQGAVLMDDLTLWKPVLILFDLDNSQVPWREWVALVKSAPATRRIPVLCFGAHVGLKARQAAEGAGAELVILRSRLVEDFPEIIPKYARRPDYPAIAEACQAPLSERAIQGLELFNRREFFEAHEVLEEAWKADHTAGRELYRAIIQIAVAYLQIERANYNGAVKMFWRSRQWIDPLPDQCRGVDVARLKSDSAAVQTRLLDLGRERIAEFDHQLFLPIHYKLAP